MRSDIISSITVGDISQDLTDHYRNIWELSRKLNLEKSSFIYYELYELCLNQTRRQRYMPIALARYASKGEAKLIVSGDKSY